MRYEKIILSSISMYVFLLITAPIVLQAEDALEGKVIFESKCGQCHDISRSLSKTKNLEEWKVTVQRMAKKKQGLINKAEEAKIAEYLNSLNKK
ncbi:MAG: hypothetical protein KJ915_02315 [Candidatus Omnitrophica bacterium]|nr:hypothetical protein [Candidatus Omnitrophota bacterium]